jgi:hypothetical protein
MPVLQSYPAPRSVLVLVIVLVLRATSSRSDRPGPNRP